MYTWHKKQAQYETYVLVKQNEPQTYIEVVPERGAIVSKYVCEGKDIFYLDEATLADMSKNIRGGNPVLFPISSYLENETYTIDGTAYQLKQHGFARNLPGKVLDVHADDQCASIKIELASNEETIKRYPFQFKLILTYTLSSDGLCVKAEVTNLSHQMMPFYLGYHPYFYVEDKEQLSLHIPSDHYREMIAGSVEQGKFNLKLAEANAIYDQLQSNGCEMIDAARGLKVSITYDEVYQYIVLWALDGKPFICIEPWMAPVNGMNVGIGVQQLAAGKTHTSTITIKGEQID